MWNTKTNKVPKSISLAHSKPFRDRAVDGKNEVESVQVEDVLDEVKGQCCVGEINGMMRVMMREKMLMVRVKAFVMKLIMFM